MTTRNLKFKVNGNYIIVYENQKKLFKISNNQNNARELLNLCRR